MAAREKRNGPDLGPTGRKWYNSDFVRLLLVLVTSGMIGGTTSFVSDGVQGDLMPMENQSAIELLEHDLENYMESHEREEDLEYQILLGKLSELKAAIDHMKDDLKEVKEDVKDLKNLHVGGNYEKDFVPFNFTDSSFATVTE